LAKGAGLKIRAETLHENAVTRNVLIGSLLTFSRRASGCTKMQQNEADPALNPAPDFAAARRCARWYVPRSVAMKIQTTRPNPRNRRYAIADERDHSPW
jgi:hypothetical protein